MPPLEQPALLSGVRPCPSRPEKSLANWDTARPGRHDRTSSLGADLQKSHYLKFGPENFAAHGGLTKDLGKRSMAQRQENAHSADITAISAAMSLLPGLAGWRRSADRTSLWRDSLLTGKRTGYSMDSGQFSAKQV